MQLSAPGRNCEHGDSRDARTRNADAPCAHAGSSNAATPSCADSCFNNAENRPKQGVRQATADGTLDPGVAFQPNASAVHAIYAIYADCAGRARSPRSDCVEPHRVWLGAVRSDGLYRRGVLGRQEHDQGAAV